MFMYSILVVLSSPLFATGRFGMGCFQTGKRKSGSNAENIPLTGLREFVKAQGICAVFCFFSCLNFPRSYILCFPWVLSNQTCIVSFVLGMYALACVGLIWISSTTWGRFHELLQPGQWFQLKVFRQRLWGAKVSGRGGLEGPGMPSTTEVPTDNVSWATEPQRPPCQTHKGNLVLEIVTTGWDSGPLPLCRNDGSRRSGARWHTTDSSMLSN